MNQINNIILEGNLASDPRLVTVSQNGSKFVKLEVANHRRFKDSFGTAQEEVLFLSCQAWGTLADKCLLYLRKGMVCRVVGRLRLCRWKTKEGEDRRTMEIVATHVEFRTSGAKDEKEIRTLSLEDDERKSLAEPTVYYEF